MSKLCVSKVEMENFKWQTVVSDYVVATVIMSHLRNVYSGFFFFFNLEELIQ